MSETTLPRDAIAPDALCAIEALEAARDATELGPAYAAAEREKKRLGAFWRLEFVLTVLWGLAFAMTFAMPSDGARVARMIGIALFVALIIIRATLARNSRRVAALKRVNDALDHWRSLVPAMRELPK
ncbi:MAG: hypothetical protein R3C27_07725 [Hyphomonadaceae bacterium]